MILNKHLEFETSLKMRFKEYLAKMRYFLKLNGKQFKLNELYKYTIEDLEDMNMRSKLSDIEKKRNERFFDDIRSNIGTLESYFYDFSKNNVGFILSGDSSLEEIINSNKIIEINLDFSTRKEEAEVLLSVLIDRICKFNTSATTKNGLVLVVDEIPNESLLNIGFEKLLISTRNCHVIFSLSDIATICEKTNLWIDKADSIFFLQQNSNKNKEYCSDFFGTYEKQKVSYTQSQNRGWSSSSSRSDGGNSSSRGKSGGYGTSNTYSTEKEKIYLPEVFASLKENEAIYFFRKNSSYGRINLF